ncbi:dihydrofolate reductase [Leuconostoc falkenbergense]|uniref:Dihydrofolate reductase n=1 Tax=Leuconostoc falkenbergense TaxID=2766470 RepID=A0A9X3IPG0_9LACO|nr:dihydrofolate reductase [Leuconostoc falkenbergense]MCX7579068.1 dihydrofolate reductase [Leuconostoc falkenbergense]
MTTIKMVWAQDKKNAIGKNGSIPWHMPDDLKLFRDETMNTLMIMGRPTWLSIGRPLPNRTSVVMTTDLNWQTNYPEVKVVHSLDDALALIKNESRAISIAGGSVIYKAFMPYATDLVVTKIDGIIDGDTFVAPIDLSQFKLTSSEAHPKDNNHDYAYVVERYKRK